MNKNIEVQGQALEKARSLLAEGGDWSKRLWVAVDKLIPRPYLALVEYVDLTPPLPQDRGYMKTIWCRLEDALDDTGIYTSGEHECDVESLALTRVEPSVDDNMVVISGEFIAKHEYRFITDTEGYDWFTKEGYKLGLKLVSEKTYEGITPKQLYYIEFSIRLNVTNWHFDNIKIEMFEEMPKVCTACGS